MPLRLRILNLARWLKEYMISWGLLSFIYSLTLTLILQPFLEKAFKQELSITRLWISTCLLLLMPAVLENIPLPPISFGWFMKQGFFGERVWHRFGSSFVPLYLRHEMRRGQTWFTVFVTVLVAGLLPEGKFALWVLFAQLPIQRALFSVFRWRTLALGFDQKKGARQILIALWCSQFIQITIAWLALGACQFLPVSKWLALGPAALGAALCGAAVAMEGDSGRPWLVNFFAMAAGTLGGFLCLASPWFLLLVVYFCKTLLNSATERLRSIEHLDEDTFIS